MKKKLLTQTILVKKAQILREPLKQTTDIITVLNSYETHIILTIIWNNLKYNFTKSENQKNNDEQIKDQMKIIFQRNIKQLAPLYAKFFKDHKSNNNN